MSETSHHVLVASDLLFTPPAATAPVLDGVSLSLAPGDLLDVSGPSGAGKTTLLRALARLLPGVSGQLSLAGTSSSEIDPREWRSHVALLPQVAAMRAGSVADNLLLPWTLKIRSSQQAPGASALKEALAGVGLDVDLDRDATRLSVGQAARVALLRVVLTGPRVLLLDEPDANLDDESAAQVGALTERFARDGGAVIRVRHLRRDEDATRRVYLSGGQLRESDACALPHTAAREARA